VHSGVLVEAVGIRSGWGGKFGCRFILCWYGHLVVGCPPVAHYLHPSQSVLGVPLPLEDDGPIEGDIASSAMKENFASSVYQGSNGE
jgi:hypothetical protein